MNILESETALRFVEGHPNWTTDIGNSKTVELHDSYYRCI